MGELTLPPAGPVYADAQIFIYSVEKHPIYAPLLRPLWESVARGDLEVVSSELTLLESLVGPLKTGASASGSGLRELFRLPRNSIAFHYGVDPPCRGTPTQC